MIYIIAAILIFGVLIAVHELGHFLAWQGLRSAGQRIFPLVWAPPSCTRQGRYHLLSRLRHRRLLCHGGERRTPTDPTALNNQSFWKNSSFLPPGPL